MESVINEVAKTNIQTKLISALVKEEISTADVGRILGINSTYLTMVKNPALWNKCPKSAWETLLAWINSGQTLKIYSEKHGKTCVEKCNSHSESITPKVIDNTRINLENEITRLMKENTSLLKELNEREINHNNKEAILSTTDPQKISIDIEINLIINGKKITL